MAYIQIVKKIKVIIKHSEGSAVNVAISAIRTKGTRINRYELVNSMQKHGYNVKYIGQASNDEIHEDYKKLNVDFIEVPLGRANTNPVKELFSLFKIRKSLKENNINGLVIYGIRTFPTMVLAARLAGVRKILCIVNGSGRLFQLRGMKGLFIKLISYPMLGLAFYLSNYILFQNPDDKVMIKQKRLLWRQNYGDVNGSGVNLKEFSFQKLPDKPVFMMISRLTGSKGINEYIKAAVQVKQIYPEAIFYLIGPMDDESSIDLEELNNAVKNRDIKLTGSVEDVKPYIKKSRVFVLPSYYPEGIPRAILEAMAMGRPIITTDMPGCRETVVDGVNGFLVRKKCSEDLAQKIIWMIKNSDKLDEMGRKSREICQEKFDVNKVNEKMLKYLQDKI